MAEFPTVDAFVDAWKEGHYEFKILIEGDSWTSHPFPTPTNLATQISSFASSRYCILNLSTPGDTATKIFNPDGKQMKLLDRLTSASGWEERFDLIVLSAGGNDIVGPEIAQLVNPLIASQEVNTGKMGAQLLTEAFYKTLDSIAEGYRAFLRMRDSSPLNRHTPVVTHTYSYLMPREVGTHLGPIEFNQGWIKIYLRHLGIKDRLEQCEIIAAMLDAFYLRIKRLEQEFLNFLVADTREVLSKNGVPNLNLWFDEIHPTRTGFRMVAERIREEATLKGMWPVP